MNKCKVNKVNVWSLPVLTGGANRSVIVGVVILCDGPLQIKNCFRVPD